MALTWTWGRRLPEGFRRRCAACARAATLCADLRFVRVSSRSIALRAVRVSFSAMCRQGRTGWGSGVWSWRSAVLGFVAVRCVVWGPVSVFAGARVFFGGFPVVVVGDGVSGGGVGVGVGVDLYVADDVEVDGVVRVAGVEDFVDGEFDAGGGAGGAFDFDVAFFGAAGAAKVVGLA